MSEYQICYHAQLPYPPIEVSCQNLCYAREMLDNLGGSNSEMSALSLYFYNQLITAEYCDVKEVFEQIGRVEMHHLQIFGELALNLGENPRFWTQKHSKKCYWTPAYLPYSCCVTELLQNALNGELAAIQKYSCQAKRICDANIVENLNRIIVDEEVHVEIFRELLCRYRT